MAWFGESWKKVVAQPDRQWPQQSLDFQFGGSLFNPDTFGPGPDLLPMPDPAGKGILYVNGKGSGFLTAYHVRGKSSTDIVSENTSQPAISLDGKRVMYIKFVSGNKNRTLVSDVDGSKQVKLASSGDLTAGTWSPDGSQISFIDSTGGEEQGLPGRCGWPRSAPNRACRGFRGLVELVRRYENGLYQLALKGRSKPTVWKADADGSHVERFLDHCCFVVDRFSGWESTCWVLWGQATTWVFYQISVKDKKQILFGSRRSNLWGALLARRKIRLVSALLRRRGHLLSANLADDDPVGRPQIALKLPFTFQMLYQGNAYDFSPDLSVVVYARPGGQADLYLLSQPQ